MRINLILEMPPMPGSAEPWSADYAVCWSAPAAGSPVPGALTRVQPARHTRGRWRPRQPHRVPSVQRMGRSQQSRRATDSPFGFTGEWQRDMDTGGLTYLQSPHRPSSALNEGLGYAETVTTVNRKRATHCTHKTRAGRGSLCVTT